MLRETDINELKKRLIKGNNAMNRLQGVYVNADKEKALYVKEALLSLEESLYFKYISIAEKLFNKKIGERMLPVPFDMKKEKEPEQLLQSAVTAAAMGVSDGAIETLYDKIIAAYNYPGNYLILIYSDTYDIPRAGTDNIDQGESEDVYTYIMCAICPVDLTAAGLQCDTSRGILRTLDRHKAVEEPSCGFIYPAFEDRAEERDRVMFYTAKPKEIPHDLMEGLGLQYTETISEIREKFNTAITRGLLGEEGAERYLTHMFERIYLIATADIDTEKQEVITAAVLKSICIGSGFGETISEKIKTQYQKMFAPNYPKAGCLISKKVIKRIEELWNKMEWQQACKKAAKEIEKLTGEETELSRDLKSLATRK